jgi:hypothetical protein
MLLRRVALLRIWLNLAGIAFLTPASWAPIGRGWRPTQPFRLEKKGHIST